MGLAMHLAQTICPMILSRYTFDLLRKPVRPAPGLTLRPDGGIWARIARLAS
jgi:cytochrome P450